MTIRELRFLALGDSYTVGEGVAVEERWPNRLAAALRALGVPLTDPVVVARTGWSTDELSEAMDREDLEPPYELVSLLIGVNNQYRGRSVEEYRKEVRTLLERAVSLTGGTPERVLVLSIPDWGVTPFADGLDRESVAREIDQFNAVKREAAAVLGTRYLDVTSISRARGGEPEMLAVDGLHPSGRMYEAWAELACPEALAAMAHPQIPPER